ASHKGQNGVLTVVGGSNKYHGASILAMKAASRFVDLVYFYSPAKLNYRVLACMKAENPCFMTLQNERELWKSIEKSDCVLVGNGLELTAKNKKLVNAILRKAVKKKRIVLDAGALHLADKRLFTRNVLVTPHPLEFKALFGVEASAEEAKKQARKWKCTVLLKKRFCFVSDGERLSASETGNEEMTKGGTGDVLAGLCAAFACKNDLFKAAQAAAFLNGFAGDLLKHERAKFNAEDLAEELPTAWKKAKGN
ncbi:MAG: NAD(P)H-hydrate dehydratase, partial [Candidatus Micrarchaeota archaeon]